MPEPEALSFWSDPPWRGGRGGFRMGLRQIDDNAWLTEAITPAERARKAALLGRNQPPVFRALDGTAAIQQQVLGAVRRQLGNASGADNELWDASVPPLIDAALLVPDDLCLMRRDGDTYRLVAACVCAPSYWSLADKIGRTLAEIHAPVPGLNPKLGRPIAGFFDRLREGSAFERRNWFLHLDDEPLHVQPEAWPEQVTDPSVLFVRSERQTLRRLDADLVLFTIRVRCRPLAEIIDYPQAAADLYQALAELSTEEQAALGYAHFADALMPYLQAIARDAVDPSGRGRT